MVDFGLHGKHNVPFSDFRRLYVELNKIEKHFSAFDVEFTYSYGKQKLNSCSAFSSLHLIKYINSDCTIYLAETKKIPRMCMVI